MVKTRLIIFLCVCCSLVQIPQLLVAQRAQISDPALNPRESAKIRSRSRLLKSDRLRLIEARQQGKPTVTLLVASDEGANERVVRGVIAIGGAVQYRDDDVSYLRVKVPTESVDVLSDAPDIEEVNIDGPEFYLSSSTSEKLSNSLHQDRIPPPNRLTPQENPYLPAGAIGAPEFMRLHPTFDGRGVTVGVVDTSIDLLLPELQSATTLDGKPTNKFADILCSAPNAIDPSDDQGGLGTYLKIDMKEEVITKGRELTYKEEFYVAPKEGGYRIGSLDERMNGSSGDLNRDGNPSGSSGLFAVLWDETANTVWVDTNQDHDFSNEKPMTDFHLHHDVGIFGRDVMGTAIRETVAFTVQTDASHKLLFIIPGYGEHGTGVTGGAFGKRFFGGSLNGVAPEAQVVLVPFGNLTHGTIEALIVAVKHPQVDIVTIEHLFVRSVNDGRSTLSVISDRLADKYKKPIFASSGNGSDQVNLIMEGAAGTKVIAVGSYISRETSRVNYGVATTREDNIDLASGRGPRKDGGLKPNILAPTMSLSTFPGFLPGKAAGDTYTLPPGYVVYGGTSTAAPFAAAGMALLVSAAKQSGVPYDADRLRWAIMSSARFLPGYGAYEQGPGLLKVGAAWQALKSAPPPTEFLSRAPVNAVLSNYLKEPHEGPGIYEREGWMVGQAGSRVITFTRATGLTKPVNYALRWLGNDGTFTSAQTITLPLRKPVSLSVTVNPKAPGVRSAILNLDELGGAPAIYQVMNTIVAAEQFGPENQFRVTREGEADWMDSKSYYIHVPIGTSALKLDVQIAQGNAMPILVRPSGYGYFIPAKMATRFTAYQTGGLWSRIVARPEPGVWQLLVDNKNFIDDSRFAAQNRARFTVTMAVLGVNSPDTIALEGSKLTNTNEITFTNRFGAFHGGVVDGVLGSTFSDRPILMCRGTPQTYEITVPEGTRMLSSRINTASDRDADLDLYLFDCTGKVCLLKDFAQQDGSNENIEVETPAAGKWKVLIDPFSVPSGETSCHYMDLFTNATFGSITQKETRGLHPNGAMWTQHVEVQISAVPTGSRYLAGFLTVNAETGTNAGENVRPTANQPIFYPTQGVVGESWIYVTNPERLIGVAGSSSERKLSGNAATPP